MGSYNLIKLWHESYRTLLSIIHNNEINIAYEMYVIMNYTYLVVLLILLSTTAYYPQTAHTDDIHVEAEDIFGNVTWINMTVSYSRIIMHNGANLTLINTTLETREIRMYVNSRLNILWNSRVEADNPYDGLRITTYGNVEILIINSTLQDIGTRYVYGFNIVGENTVVRIINSTITNVNTGSLLFRLLSADLIMINNTLIDNYRWIMLKNNIVNSLIIHNTTIRYSNIPTIDVYIRRGEISNIYSDKLKITARGVGQSNSKIIVRNIVNQLLTLSMTRINATIENITTQYQTVSITDSISRIYNFTGYGGGNTQLHTSDIRIKDSNIGYSQDAYFYNSMSRLIIENTTFMGTTLTNPIILLSRSDNAILDDISVTGGSGQIMLYQSRNVTMNNVYVEKGVDIIGNQNPSSDYPDYYRHRINNVTTSSGPIYYLRSRVNETLTVDSSEVFIVDSSNVTINYMNTYPQLIHGPEIISSTNITINNLNMGSPYVGFSNSYKLIAVYIMKSGNITIKDYSAQYMAPNGYHTTIIYASETESLNLSNLHVETDKVDQIIYGFKLSFLTINNAFLRANSGYSIVHSSTEPHQQNITSVAIVRKTNIQINNGDGIRLFYYHQTIVEESTISSLDNGLVIEGNYYQKSNMTLRNIKIYGTKKAVKVTQYYEAYINRIYASSSQSAQILCGGTRTILTNIELKGSGIEGINIHNTLNSQDNMVYMENISETDHLTGLILSNPNGAVLKNISLSHGLSLEADNETLYRINPIDVYVRGSVLRYIYNESNIMVDWNDTETILLSSRNVTVDKIHTTNLTHSLIILYSDAVITGLYDEVTANSAIQADHADILITDSVFDHFNDRYGTIPARGVDASTSNITINNSVFLTRSIAYVSNGRLIVNHVNASNNLYRVAVYLGWGGNLELSNSKINGMMIYAYDYANKKSTYIIHDSEINIINRNDRAVTILAPYANIQVYGISTKGSIFLRGLDVDVENTSVDSLSYSLNNYFVGERVWLTNLSISSESTYGSLVFIRGNEFSVIRNSIFNLTNNGLRIIGGYSYINNVVINNVNDNKIGIGLNVYNNAVIINALIHGYSIGIYRSSTNPIYVLNTTITRCNYVFRTYTITDNPVRIGNSHAINNIWIVDTDPNKIIGYYVNFSYNERDAILLRRTYGDINIHYSTIMSNGRLGANIYTGKANLSLNYWGDPGGPEYTPYGNAVDPEEIYNRSGTLIYRPFLSVPPTRNTVPPHFNDVLISSLQRLSGTALVAYNATDDEEIFAVIMWLDDNLIHVGGETGLVSIDTTQYSDGNHTLTLVAYDYAGNSYTYTRTVLIDNTYPIVTILRPANNSLVNKDIVLELQIDEIDLQGTDIYVDNNYYASNTSSNPIFSIDTSLLTDGTHLFTTITSDHIGHTTLINTTLVVDNTGPTTIIYLANQTILHGNASITASANDEHPYNTTLYLGATPISYWSTPDNYTVILDTLNYPDGTYTLRLYSSDGAGNTGETSITVLIDNNAPVLAGFAVNGNNTSGETITIGIVLDDAFPDTLIIMLDNTTIYTGPYNDPVNLTVNGLTPGRHMIRIIANDTSGYILNISYTLILRLSPMPEPYILPTILLAAIILMFYLRRHRS